MEEEKRPKFPKIIDNTLCWAIQPFLSRVDNKSILYILNKLFKGKVTGAITLNKNELKNLKRFMAERKFE